MASFKASSDCSRACPVMVWRSSKVEIPQPFRALFCRLTTSPWRIFSSISSEFPLLELLPLSLILSLQEEPDSIRCSHPLGRWRQLSDSLPHHLFRLHKSSYLRLSWYITDWGPLTDSWALRWACISLSVFFLLRDAPDKHSAHQQPHKCWEAITSLDLLRHTHAHSLVGC